MKKINKKLKSYLAFGSLLLTTLFIQGCYKEIDYISLVNWIYINRSSHNIVIDNIYPNAGSNSSNHWEDEEIVDSIKSGKTSDNYFTYPSGEYVDESTYFLPFVDSTLIYIDGEEYIIEDGEFIRDKDNYNIEYVAEHHYKFTYEFTDEIIEEIMAE